MSRMLTAADVAECRERICTVAAQLFAERGPEGFNLRELAGRLGVSAMTPYRYFTDKEAIISEVRARAFARFADWLEARLTAPGADETTLGCACVEYAVQEPSQYRLMFALVQPVLSPRPPHVAQEGRVRDMMAAYFRTLVGRGRLSGDPERLGIIFWSVLHGTAAFYAAGILSYRELDRALCDTMLLFIGNAGVMPRRPVNAVYGNGHASP